MSLHEKAILVTFKTSAFGETKKIRGANKLAKSDWINDTKRLISKTALVGAKKVLGAARNYHYTVTLPFSDNNERLLPNELYMDYLAKVNQFKQELRAELETINFSAEIANARAALSAVEDKSGNLHNLFDPNDYPGDIAGKFGIELEFSPVPDSGHLVIDLPAEEIARLRDQIDSQVSGKADAAMRDVWERIHGVIQKAWETLKDPEAKFKDSLIKNIQNLIDVLPALNIMGDANLDQVAQKARQTLCQYDPDDLRKNPGTRTSAVNESAQILEDLEWFMSLPGEGPHKSEPAPTQPETVPADPYAGLYQDDESEGSHAA